MSTEDNVRQVIKPHLPHRAKHRAANAELADLPFVDDAARRLGASAQALFEYFARLNALRAAANDIGHAALAERAVRAELHTRIALSSGLDALNELHDLGLLQQAMQTAIKTPADITRTTLPDAARRAMAVLGQRYPDQQWDWLGGASDLFADVKLHCDVHGGALRVTIAQGGHPTTVLLSPDAGQRTDTSAFFSPGSSRIYVGTSGFSATETGPTGPRSAYDSAIDGLAFAREWVYRHARNAAEMGAPARAGAGPAVIVIALVVLGALCLTVGIIESVVCKKDQDKAACTWADILIPLGVALLGSGGGKQAADGTSGPNSGTSMQFGTNQQ